MNDEVRAVAEELLCAVFIEMLEFANEYGITVKRMRELLPATQLRALEAAGLDQGEIVAHSGYTRKSIRKILSQEISRDCINPVDRFVSDWASDPDFSDDLSLDGEYPSFRHLHDQYGGEFTAPGLLKLLSERGIISIENDTVILDPQRKVTANTTVDMIQAAQCSLVSLFGTLKHNLRYLDEPFTERRIWSASIPVDSIDQLREEMRQINLDNQKQITAAIAKYEVSRDSVGPASLARVGVGIYWFEKKYS